MAIRNSTDFLRYHELIFGPSDRTKSIRNIKTRQNSKVGVIISPRKPKGRPQQIEEQE